MNRAGLTKLSVDELVEQFRNYALQQDEALLSGEQSKVNRLFWKLRDVEGELEGELKRRDGDQRSALLRLYDHPNAQVRVKAIKASLAVAPELGREALQALANSKNYPAAMEAGMSIRALDRGIFKPT
jgi:hypothetical protein